MEPSVKVVLLWKCFDIWTNSAKINIRLKEEHNMKCPTCGKTVAKKASVCKHCGVDLLAKEPTNEVVEIVTEVVEEPVVTEHSEKKPKFISIKPETTEKVKTNFLNAFKYIAHAITHPSAEKMPLDLTQIICVDSIIAIVYILWLYIVQRGMLLTYIKGYDEIALTKISSVTTIIGGIALVFGLVLLVSFIVAIKNFVRKEKIDLISILQDATHILLVPSMLLLLATVIAAFWFSIGVFFFCVTFVSLFMNIVLLFKDNNNYFSYIIVSITIAMMIFLIYYVLYFCAENWTASGQKIGDILKGLIMY